MLAAYDAKDGHVADGQKTLRTWLVHMARLTRGQAAQYLAIRALPRDHAPMLAGLRTRAVTTSEALQLAKWTRAIPAEFRTQAEEILIAAARAGANLRGAGADLRGGLVPDRPAGPGRERPRSWTGRCPWTRPWTVPGPARRPHPECAAMVQAVLDALSAREGSGDLRTRAQRYHDALAEAMR